MRVIVLLLLTATAAVAQEPSEQAKKDALMRAYHLNGDRMCCGFVDLTLETPKVVKTQKIEPTPPKRNCVLTKHFGCQ